MFRSKKENVDVKKKEDIMLGVMKANPMVMVIGFKKEDELVNAARVNIGYTDEQTGKMKLEFIPLGWPLILDKFIATLNLSDISPIILSNLDPAPAKEIERVVTNNYYKEITGIQL